MCKGAWERRSRVAKASNAEGHVAEHKAQEVGLGQFGKTPTHQVKKLIFLFCKQ